MTDYRCPACKSTEHRSVLKRTCERCGLTDEAIITSRSQVKKFARRFRAGKASLGRKRMKHGRQVYCG